jgi:diacylglycerol kinase
LSRRRGSLLTSFNFAFDGIVHALRTERNMWIHFGIAALVLIAALFFALTRLEVIALLVAISFVVITEVFNTAIEHVVDLVTDEDDPRARVAKDVAAGAVRQQDGDFERRRELVLRRLPERPPGAHDDVAEHERRPVLAGEGRLGDLAQVGRERSRRARLADLVLLPLLEREAQHVGDLVPVAVLAVDLAHAPLPDERDVHLGAAHALLLEHARHEPRDELLVDGRARPVDALDDVHEPAPLRRFSASARRCSRAAPT